MATTLLAGAAVLPFATPAEAQDAPATQEIGDVVITGSRIPQSNLVTTSPVTQVTGEDVDVAGVTRVEDLVAQLPQAFAAQNSTVSNGASGTATVSLRNLGSSRTLVLIDGRRMGYGSPNDPAADLNQIPEQLVERVEVLTGGASAVYGSDAVAGVVNFIMKKDFEGLQLDAQYGFYQHNNDYDGVGNLRSVIAGRAATNPAQFALPDDSVSDGESRSLNVTLGVSSPDGRGNLLAYAGYRNNNPILQADRDYSACAIADAAAATPQAFTCGGSGTSFPGRFTDFGGGPGFNSTLGAGRTFVPFDNALHQYNYGPLNYYQRPDERYTMGAFGRYEVNDKAEVFAQLMFSDYRSVSQIAPSGNFFSTNTINCGNPLLGPQQASTIGCTAGDIAADTRRVMYIGRRNVEGGGRQDDLNYTSYRGVVGVRGEFAPGWNYDVAAQYSRVALARTYNNDFSTTRLGRALDVVDVAGTPTCRSVVDGSDPTCVPYDIFVVGGVTQAALNYVQIPLIQRGETTQQVVTAAITGDTGWSMPAASRTVQVALGAEYRRDALGSTTDAAFASGDGAGQGGPTIGLSGDADVAEVFGEIQIPLADDQPWAYSASIDAAYRRSEYENISTDTYKIGADYAPVEDIRFRASYSRAVRAPNVIELFSAQGFGLFDADRDPCDASTGAVAPNCIGGGAHQVTAVQSASGALDSPADQYNLLGGGNPNLNPEEADTFTYGFVWTPSFAPTFNLTVDYFDIQVDSLVSTVGALNTLALCYSATPDAAACNRITRNVGGQLWIGSGVVQDLNQNIGGLANTGWDFNANYGFDLEDLGPSNLGSMQLSFVGTLLNELVTDTGLGGASSVYDCAGFYANQCGVPNPEWRHRARATWLTPWNVDISATWRHYGEAEVAVLTADGSLNNGGARIDRYFEAENYLDLAATWQVMDTVVLRAGVNNILDNDPQLTTSTGTTGNGNTFPQVYDSMGRYVFFGLTANF
ncbi:MAG: TonB-dependent receptor [Alphaproteobacteria bacterium]|nr:TonB-dependent receptor [Alphaproteobacteria bacterium]MBU2041159.1 TonB-dependent receptor [Alphaproteobacteria bacterium]MBU2125536.1 TonB-dependent receptor [Alphaproteobacteria bacterium]MBU2208505.1 TonB-dependent receptor [Alphaproteobacteria bacterium]MBU2289930.1 TonB-dependent receptor [Alphaproteobacteria bacterium]